jgi:hypothetical protein
MSPLLAIIVIVISAVVMIALMLLVRRHAPSRGRFAGSVGASSVFGFLGSGFVILLGFVIFLSFGTYESAATRADAEAAAVTAQFRTAYDFGGDRAGEAQGQLVCYARSVISQEWQSLQDGQRSPVTAAWMVGLEDVGVKEQNATSSAAEPVKAWWASTNERNLGRSGRVLVAEGQIPVLLWALLVVAAILVVGYVLLYADPDEGWLAQASMMGGVTVLVVSSLLAVQVLAVPFSGESGSINPASMEYALAQMDQFANADLEAAPFVYCNKAGLPLAK